MILAAGERIGWADLPVAVRVGVEAVLGDHVVEAVSQVGGFSPGSADRVRTASGRRAFVKAVSVALNADSVALHRREARITAGLPPVAAAPRVLGVHDQGDWVAIVLEDVEGRNPATPWVVGELASVLEALDSLGSGLGSASVLDLPEAAATFGESFAGWRQLRTDPWPGLDPWAADNLDLLCTLADRGAAVTDGDSIVHSDLRADNLLVRPDGSVMLVDWPWAVRGAPWLDTVLLLVNVNLFGGHDVEALLPDVPAEDVTAFLAGLSGFFLDQARRPAPPGIPTVREFQRVQGDSVLRWVRERLAQAGTSSGRGTEPRPPISTLEIRNQAKNP